MNASADKVGTNSDIRHANAALLSITHELPSEVVTSDYFDEQLGSKPISVCMPKGVAGAPCRQLAPPRLPRPDLRDSGRPQPILLRRRQADRSQIAFR